MTELLTVADLKPPPPPSPKDLRPPPRFAGVAFETYAPQHPSQAAARDQLREFVLGRDWRHRAGGRGATPTWWPWQRSKAAPGAGLYLDGGFGVGKTHLLAATYAAADTPEKRYLSFQELVYLIGVLGMAGAHAEFAATELLCIDEFELDDPGNTLIVKTFLAARFAAGTAVVTTSNTPPAAQGQGRFNADDFRREIQSLAASFRVIPVDGPDYRQRAQRGSWTSEAELSRRIATERAPGPRLSLSWQELLDLLRSVHPTRFGGLLAQVRVVYLHGVAPLASQNDALRFVHFVDKAYDRQVGLRASGAGALQDVFDPSYREGAYAKKHHRCVSRLAELLGEGTSRTVAAPTEPEGDVLTPTGD